MKIHTLPQSLPSRAGKIAPLCGRGQAKGLYADEF